MRTYDDNNPHRNAIMVFIHQYWTDNLRSPSMREICDGCGISSTSVVNYHLRALTEHGFLREREYNIYRSYIPTDMGIVFTGEGKDVDH